MTLQEHHKLCHALEQVEQHNYLKGFQEGKEMGYREAREDNLFDNIQYVKRREG